MYVISTFKDAWLDLATLCTLLNKLAAMMPNYYKHWTCALQFEDQLFHADILGNLYLDLDSFPPSRRKICDIYNANNLDFKNFNLDNF